MYNIIGKRNIFLAVSAILTVGAIVVWLVWGFNLGIDFTGGTLMQLKFDNVRPVNADIQTALAQVQDLGDVQIQTVGDNEAVLKFKFVSNEQRSAILKALPDAHEETFESIGPSVGAEMARKSWIAFILAVIGMIAYITWAFRHVSMGPVRSWVYGVSAIIALVHDALIMIGVFVILGHFYKVEMNAMFITAILTVIGYSVNDTIVVFDRIREQLKISTKNTFEEIINDSINTTLARSLNTTLTTLLCLVAIYLFGGETIRYFVLALIVGITTGAYSSIFIASPFLLYFQKILKK